jgi:hypothetical protein
MAREGGQAGPTRTGARGRPGGRGRPPKFGRPSQVVALTLPEDVLDLLRTFHRDPGWAIVQLVESTVGGGAGRRASREPTALAELVYLPGRRGLIVVQPQAFKGLRGVSTIPLADGRAFLAFDQAGGLADLEVAILDALEVAPADSGDHAQLTQIRQIVRAWRRDQRLAFRTKTIIVVEGVGVRERELLAPPQDIKAATESGEHRRRRRRRV